jgi:diguanylate cyclase (GGDEF)-like protein
MEVRTYLQIVFKHWWIVLLAFLITLTATAVLTFTQPRIYRSTATFVVSPSSEFADVRAFATGLDTLSRRTEIATTYGEVASSRSIKRTALDNLGLPAEQRGSVSISSRLVAGTNILEITAKAPDLVLARDAASAVGAEMMAYVQELYEPYILRPLDGASVPRAPVKPNVMLNIALGAVFGLVLGCGLALLVEYLRMPPETLTNASVIDANTGMYNKSFFMQRLDAEIARAKRHDYQLSVAMLNIDQSGVLQDKSSPEIKHEILRKMAVVLRNHLREEDVVARFEDATMAVLLPDMPVEVAKAKMDELQMRMAGTTFELEGSHTRVNLSSVAGVASFDHSCIERDELISRASQALNLAGTNGYNKTYVAAETSSG